MTTLLDPPAPPAPEPPPYERDAFEARDRARATWVLVSLAFAGAALIWSIFSWGMASRAENEAKKATAGGATAAPSAPVMVHLAEYSISPSTVEVPVGGTLQVMNLGTMPHNLAVQGSGVATPMIPASSQANLELRGLAEGTYTIYCQVPGHKEAGMKATLHVVAAGTTLASGASGGVTASPSVSDMDTAMLATTKAFPAKTEGVGAQLLAPTVLADGTKQFDVTAEVVQWEVSPGKKVEAWTYNGTVPAPTIQVNPGDKVRVVLHNRLPESTAIHFHGIDVPNSMDGVPGVTQDPVKPGADFTYSFTAQSTPAVGMYHSHYDAVKQVADGMAGAFLIGEEPVPAGVQVSQHQIMMLDDSGTIGLALNGKSFPATAPVIAKRGEWVEVQYLNEGTMIHPMHLHGLAQMVIAKDGFPLASPEMEDTIAVAPGERYTVLVHATALGVWAWHCHILSHAENDTGMFGMVTAFIVKPAQA